MEEATRIVPADPNTDSESAGSSKGKTPRAPTYNWTVNALGQPCDTRQLKLVQNYTVDRYGQGPYTQDVKELSTSKCEREASLEARIRDDDVFSTMVDGALVKASVTGSAAYQKAQSIIRTFKNFFLSANSNRSGQDGAFTPLQSACLECIKADNCCALKASEKKEAAEEEARQLASLERDLGLLGPDEVQAAFKDGSVIIEIISCFVHSTYMFQRQWASGAQGALRKRKKRRISADSASSFTGDDEDSEEPRSDSDDPMVKLLKLTESSEEKIGLAMEKKNEAEKTHQEEVTQLLTKSLEVQRESAEANRVQAELNLKTSATLQVISSTLQEQGAGLSALMTQFMQKFKE